MSFASKRKARIIRTRDEDDDAPDVPASSTSGSTNKSVVPKSAVIRSKPFRKSGLRQSIAFDDPEPMNSTETSEDGAPVPKPEIREVDFGPSKPRGNKAESSKRKPKIASRLSFGPGKIISGEDADALEEEFAPKKLAGRNIEPSSLRINLGGEWEGPASGPPEEERPRYSRDYLNELKGSTPSTPKEMQGAPQLGDAMEEDKGLDVSELEGAMIVDNEESGSAYIPTDAEIAEKKERRARLAQEQDFISLDSGPNDRYAGGSMISQLSSRPKKESRLVRDDEDIMEGFDNMVQDAPIALGRKAEREARRMQRKMISQAIQDAEGSDTAESDDSEAERNAEYEAAQTRAGMDGLKKLNGVDGAASMIPPKVTPIPSLGECLGRLKMNLEHAEKELTKQKWQMETLEQEKKEIEVREKEVQRLLREAGDRYSSLRAGAGAELPQVDVGDMKSYVGAADGVAKFVEKPVGRGLESIGSTPVRNEGMGDEG